MEKDKCGFITIYHKLDCYDERYDNSCECNEKTGTNIKERFFQIDGKKEGKYELYFSNGDIGIECFYINNKIEGVHKSYWGDNHVIEEYYYINNKKEGEYKKYYYNGNIWVKCNYSNNKLNGEYISFKENENGIIIQERIYINDKIII